MDSCPRTVKDVNSVVAHAKLEVNELRPLVQVLYTGNSFDEFRLLELNGEIGSRLSLGETIYFRGEKQDRVVLCTEDSTYDVKEAETSNSLVLIPGLKFSDSILPTNDSKSIEQKQISGIYREYLEVKKCKPKLNKLRNLLLESAYDGPELEVEREGLCTTNSLLMKVQASRKELEDSLREMDALIIDGKWRILSRDYEFRCLGQLLNLTDSNCWAYDSIPIRETIETLKEILPYDIVNYLVEIYLDPTGINDEEDELFTLRSDKVCRFIGDSLLKPAEKFNLEDFLQLWQQSVPEGMEIDLKQLNGLCLISRGQHPHCIWSFDESNLSDDLQERFNQLFKERPMWTFDEIEPFIRRLATERQTVNSLLTRYSRSANVNGIRTYSARHGK